MRSIASFCRNKDGVAALEFAMILWPMLVLLLGGVEISTLLVVDRKTTAVAASLSDLVAQATTITNNDRDNVFAAGNSLVAPYDSANLKVVISSVIYQNNQPTIAWSDATPGATARAVGSVLPIGDNPGQIPDGLVASNATVIMAEASYHFEDATSHLLTGPHEFSATFFNRPRRVIAVGRTP